VERLKGASLWKAPALPTNNDIHRCSMEKLARLAYYENLLITSVISFIVQAPVANTVDQFNDLRHSFSLLATQKCWSNCSARVPSENLEGLSAVDRVRDFEF
jgi:hypothetical protein